MNLDLSNWIISTFCHHSRKGKKNKILYIAMNKLEQLWLFVIDDSNPEEEKEIFRLKKVVWDIESFICGIWIFVNFAPRISVKEVNWLNVLPRDFMELFFIYLSGWVIENQPYFWMRKAFGSNLNRILTKYLNNSFFMLFIVISCGKSRGIQQENVAQVSYQENKNLE